MSCSDIFDMAVSIITSIGSIATALSLIFLIKQTIANKESIELLQKTYNYTSDWQCKEKAIELACYYKDNILSEVSYINGLLKDTGALSLLGNIRNGDIDMFTYDELISFVGPGIVEKIYSKIADISNLDTLIYSRLIFNDSVHKGANMNDALIEKWREADKESENYTSKGEALAACLCDEFMETIANTLNNLEYFSMYFITKVADESVVFQSLHQTYLQSVRALYFFIASQNSNPKDKFYTNVIELYHIWSKRDVENGRRANSTVQPVSAVRK